jgi:hypothetical protein
VLDGGAVDRLPGLPAGDHQHVDARVDGVPGVAQGASRDLRVGVPVADLNAVEAHPALEDVGDQITAAVQLVVVRRALVR